MLHERALIVLRKLYNKNKGKGQGNKINYMKTEPSFYSLPLTPQKIKL